MPIGGSAARTLNGARSTAARLAFAGPLRALPASAEAAQRDALARCQRGARRPARDAQSVQSIARMLVGLRGPAEELEALEHSSQWNTGGAAPWRRSMTTSDASTKRSEELALFKSECCPIGARVGSALLRLSRDLQSISDLQTAVLKRQSQGNAEYHHMRSNNCASLMGDCTEPVPARIRVGTSVFIGVMHPKSGAWAVVHAGLCLLLLSSTARAKSYKSGEFISKTRFGFGAFEARIRSAKGPGVISTFFLWRPDSEKAPAVPWHEIDFEMGLDSADYQTQIMTPGTSPPMYRTEHAVPRIMAARPYQAYYTYRIEWTPSYVAFFVDGTEVRRETDPAVYGALFSKDSAGHTPSNERMELRTGAWPGDASIAGWSGAFDGSNVPTAHFVDYVKVWDYTPNQLNKFATVLLDDQFNSLNTNTWSAANWSFDFSASDYISQNIGVKNGRLVVALTTSAGQGILPAPPADVPPIIPVPSVRDGFVLEAEKYDSFSDTTSGNSGEPSCSSTDVDAQLTMDPKGGTCYVGWAAPGEWLQYDVQLPKDDEYVVTFRIASQVATTYLHLELDGVDVSGPVYGPGLGWQTFVDAVVPGVFIGAGAHSLRLVFDSGDVNVNYLAFERVSTATDPCEMSCDDGNPCTTDSCDRLTGCQFLNNTLACADDGNSCTNDVCAAGACTHPNNSLACSDDNNSCTNDVCSAGVCTHPSNNTCNTSTVPCAGLCTNPVIFTGNNFNSGNIGSGAGCYQTTASLKGGVCGNFASGRKLTVNGVQMSCAGNWPSPLPAKRNAGYCVQTTPGAYAWAYFATW